MSHKRDVLHVITYLVDKTKKLEDNLMTLKCINREKNNRF